MALVFQPNAKQPLTGVPPTSVQMQSVNACIYNIRNRRGNVSESVNTEEIGTTTAVIVVVVSSVGTKNTASELTISRTDRTIISTA